MNQDFDNKKTIYRKKDVERKEELDTLIEIIDNKDYYKENSSNGLSIILNGGWGTGKTTFVKKFKEYASEKYNILEIYNSFEYDFYDNAYIPFFSHIKENLDIDIDVDKIANITAKQISKQFLNITYKVIRGLIKSKTELDIDDAKKIINPIYEEYIEENDEYKKFKELKNIKDSIKELIRKKAIDKPIIIIIDELDRCNPKFALSTLEIVKYFFDIDNFIIILSLDQKQLEESVKTIYGSGMNSDIYFSKFFDYQFNLNRIKFIDAIDFSSIDGAPEIVNSIEHIFSCLNISIRDSYKIFNEFINKYKKFSEKGIKWTKQQCVFILFILTAKNTDLMLYNSIINDNFDNYKNQLLNNNNIDKKKYIDLFSSKIDTNISLEKCIRELTINRDKEYIDTKYLHSKTIDLELNRKINILNNMYVFLPRVLQEKTYKDNYLYIFNN